MVILLAHGAGAPSSSPWMVGWKKRLSTIAPTMSFDYRYMREHRRAPDPLPKLIATHREALAAALAEHSAPAVLAGKSMGSRVGCHVALEDPAVRALVCFGYPLAAAGKRTSIRDEVLLALKVPILFVQGTRDPLCPLDLLEGVRARMQIASRLHTVEGGDHSLNVSASARKASGETQADSDAKVLAAVKSFLGDQLPAR
jgi:predicted alpha/beta-hydrolase family hydrolase